MTNEHDKDKVDDRDRGIPIQIDNKKYTAPKTPMTGAELRVLADPDIGPDRDLWLTVPGPADDRLVGDHDRIDLKPGMHFYSAPRTINPGGTDATS